MGRSTAVSPYFDPVAGPTSPKNYSAGVYMEITGGDFCEGGGVLRSSYLWLKCDPTVTARPTTVNVDEWDPSNPNVETLCKYHFDVISHASFCPVQNVTSTQAQIKQK
jgi:hypothetical protein